MGVYEPPVIVVTDLIDVHSYVYSNYPTNILEFVTCKFMKYKSGSIDPCKLNYLGREKYIEIYEIHCPSTLLSELKTMVDILFNSIVKISKDYSGCEFVRLIIAGVKASTPKEEGFDI